MLDLRVTKTRDAYLAGGYRERYAMENGEKKILVNGGRVLWRFTYGPKVPYQDANGATYDTERRAWVG